jgi:hypothetical protein
MVNRRRACVIAHQMAQEVADVLAGAPISQIAPIRTRGLQ